MLPPVPDTSIDTDIQDYLSILLNSLHSFSTLEEKVIENKIYLKFHFENTDT